MIVDAHCHAGSGEGLSAPWNTRAVLARYLRRARMVGIRCTVIFPVLTRDYPRANAEVAALAERSRGRFIPFAALHARRDAGAAARNLGEAVRLGCRGVKVHQLDAPITREVCEAALHWNLPVIYDVAGEVYRLEMICSEYPRLQVIAPHLGSFADDWRAHQALIDLMKRFSNLYADTSGVRRFNYLVQAVRQVGPDRIIFGSDGPWLHPGLELYKVRLLHLPPADERLILGENISRLLALVQLVSSQKTSMAAPWRGNFQVT